MVTVVCAGLRPQAAPAEHRTTKTRRQARWVFGLETAFAENAQAWEGNGLSLVQPSHHDLRAGFVLCLVLARLLCQWSGIQLLRGLPGGRQL